MLPVQSPDALRSRSSPGAVAQQQDYDPCCMYVRRQIIHKRQVRTPCCRCCTPSAYANGGMISVRLPASSEGSLPFSTPEATCNQPPRVATPRCGHPVGRGPQDAFHPLCRGPLLVWKANAGPSVRGHDSLTYSPRATPSPLPLLNSTLGVVSTISTTTVSFQAHLLICLSYCSAKLTPK